MDPRIEATVRKTETSLTSIPGVGPFIAAKILGEVGDPSRIRSKPAFAVLSGTAPLSASSGQVQRHRLNRGGNRQLNWALHYIALVQCRIMPDAQAYMDRQREAGKSHKEAMRCLKRHLSNVVYRHLVTDARRTDSAANAPSSAALNRSRATDARALKHRSTTGAIPHFPLPSCAAGD